LLVILVLTGHVLLARRHLLHPRGDTAPVVEPAWPRQVYFNTLVTAVILGFVALLVVLNAGVSLEAPADPASQYPARPAWFFLWLFELRKYFLGPREIIATAVIPASVAAVMVLIPFLDRIFPRRFAHFLACAFAFAVLGGICVLTGRSVWVDAHDADYTAGTRHWAVARDRAVALAFQGIPPEGAPALLNRDPLYQGHALLQAKCLGCHAHGEEKPEQPTAPDLKGYGTRAWVRGLLENPGAPEYFGKIPSCQGMVGWKKSSKLDAKQLDAVADFIAGFARIPRDVSPEEWINTKAVSEHPGLEPFSKECGACHVVAEGLGDGNTQDAPGLFGWGSPWWTARLIRKPSAPDLYGYLEPEHQMPGFAGQLTETDELAIIRYLKNDYLGAPGADSSTKAASLKAH
jgi:ubiquinol-cytochrome c reductase cytochrome b subunit